MAWCSCVEGAKVEVGEGKTPMCRIAPVGSVRTWWTVKTVALLGSESFSGTAAGVGVVMIPVSDGCPPP